MAKSPRRSLKEQFKASLKGIQTALGREIPDPTPMAPPVGYTRAPSLSDQIREMVRSERLARDLAEQGVETFEEADDFDIGDDYDPSTPYEETFDNEGNSSFEPIASVNAKEEAKNKKAKESQPPKPDPKDPPKDPPKADPPKDDGEAGK